MRLDPRQIEAVDDEMARVLRGKSGVERLKIAGRMYVSAHRVILHRLRTEHPEWTEDQVCRFCGVVAAWHGTLLLR